jgi:hypothetical protein
MEMAQIDHKSISLYEDSKSGLSSLIQQVVAVFLGSVVMLLVTGGAPSASVLAVSFCLGTALVSWSEQKRITKLRTAPSVATSKNLLNESVHQKTFLINIQSSILQIGDSVYRIKNIDSVEVFKSQTSAIKSIKPIKPNEPYAILIRFSGGYTVLCESRDMEKIHEVFHEIHTAMAEQVRGNQAYNHSVTVNGNVINQQENNALGLSKGKEV